MGNWHGQERMVVRSYGSGRLGLDWRICEIEGRASLSLSVCDVCWQRQGHIHAANPLGETARICKLERKTCVLGYWHHRAIWSKRDTTGTRDSFQAKDSHQAIHCQSRGPGASLVTTAACCPVKEGALTIRFWRARPASASIQDAYMAFPARSLPRIPVMSPMPPLQEGDALPWCHLPPACVRCCRVVSLRCRAAQWSKPPRARPSETSSPPLPLLCPLSLFASNPVIPPQIPPSVTLIPRATSSTRNELHLTHSYATLPYPPAITLHLHHHGV